MKYTITEVVTSATGFVYYTVEANSPEHALELYNDDKADFDSDDINVEDIDPVDIGCIEES